MSTEQQPVEQAVKPSIQVANAGRRRLGKAGIGAAGVLLTLESRVAMATGPKCVAPSAAALSHGGNSNYVEKGRCNAQPPEYWCRMSHYWPCSKDIKFGELFRCKGNDVRYANVKLIEILGNSTYRNYIGRAVATTYFNILSGKLTVLDNETLFKMWSDLQTRQIYSPMKKVYWTPRQVRDYLESTYRA